MTGGATELSGPEEPLHPLPSPNETTQPTSSGPFRLVRFDPQFAPRVAAWVSSPGELFHLTPTTPPPLTAEKVLAWCRPTDHPFMLMPRGSDCPCGYAELNPMRWHPDQFWIGHVILDPATRGQGVGTQFMELLADMGFETLGAQRLLLIVFPDNEPAIACYRRTGFELCGQEHHRFGPHRRRYRMLRFALEPCRWQAAQASRIGQPLRCPAQTSP